jgi:hypothetical protein
MDRQIRSKAGPAIDALRTIIAAPVFGSIKVARGLDRFLRRGTEQPFGALNLIAINYNLLKLHRAALNAVGGGESGRYRRPTASQGPAQSTHSDLHPRNHPWA